MAKSLASCIKAAGKALSKTDATAIVKIRDELAETMSTSEADVAAVKQYLEQLRSELKGLTDEIAARGADAQPLVDELVIKPAAVPTPEERAIADRAAAQVEYDKAVKAIKDLGAEPAKPSSEEKRFGEAGRAGASPEAVARYDQELKDHRKWKRQYAAAIKKRDEAAEKLDVAEEKEKAPEKITRAEARFASTGKRTRPKPKALPRPNIDEVPAKLIDVRLKRSAFRVGLRAMASQLERGGGVTAILGEDQGGAQGQIIDRTQSSNPDWFQGLAANKDTKLSVEAVWRAVDKALLGLELGKKEAAFVTGMLDEISDERIRGRYGNALDEARARLEDAREKRLGPKAPEVPMELYEQLGEVYEESEYPADFTTDERVEFDLYMAIEEAGGDPSAIDFPDAATAALHYDEQLEALYAKPESESADQEEQAEPAPAGEAEADLAGEVPTGQQALADEIRRRERPPAETDMTGTMLGGDRGQQDLMDIEGVDVRRVEEPAYHGSPHPKLEGGKLSTKYIGTGEGHGMRGWGIYLSGKHAVAKWYRDTLARNAPIGEEILARYFEPGRIVKSYGGFDRVVKFNPSYTDTTTKYHVVQIDDKHWRLARNDDPKRMSPVSFQDRKTADNEAARMNERGVYHHWTVTVEGTGTDKQRRTHSTTPSHEDLMKVLPDLTFGHIYHVDVPDVSEMLDWDKTISSQSDDVRVALQPILAELKNIVLTGEELYYELGKKLAEKALSDRLANAAPGETRDQILDELEEKGPELASKALLEAGIPALTYIGESSGEQNYVVFDEERITINKVEERKRHEREDRQLQLFVDSEPVETQAGAPRAAVAKTAAVEAVQDLRSSASLAAIAMSSDFAARQRTSLVGQVVETPADLAIVSQVFRDPRFETFRLVFVKAGQVFSQFGLTARLPSSAVAIVGDDSVAYFKSLAAYAKENEIDGYYMLHNHPSGESTASTADRMITRRFNQHIPGFLGHVVIDTNNYSVIDKEGNARRHDADFGQPTLKEFTDGELTPKAALKIARGLQLDPQGLVAIVVSGKNAVWRVLSVATVDTSGKSIQRALMKATLKARGSAVVIVSRDRALLSKASRFAIGAIHITDSGQAVPVIDATDPYAVPWGKAIDARPGRLSPDSSPDFDYLRGIRPVERGARVREPVASLGRNPEERRTIAKLGMGTQQPKTILDKLKEFRKDWRSKVRQGVVDQFDSFRSILKDDRAWMLAHLVQTGTGSLEAAIEQGRIYIDAEGVLAVDRSLPSLKKILEPLGKDLDYFLMWIAGNRMARLAAEDREHLADGFDIDVLQRMNQGNEALWDKVRTDFEDWSNAITDVAVKTGMVDIEEAQKWRDEGFYLPFYRVLDEDKMTDGPRGLDKQGLVRQRAFVRLKGGTEQLGDLLGNALMNWNHLLNASLKNQAATKALANPAAGKLAKDTDENTVFVRVNGKPVYFKIDNPLVFDALTAMNYDGLRGPVMDMMRSFKRVLTMGTTVSPEFKVANVLRDTIQAIAVSTLTGNPAKVVRNFYRGYKLAKAGTDTHTKMLASGAIFPESGFMHGAPQDVIREMLKAGVSRGQILDQRWRVRKMFDKYQDWGMQLENLNRANLYEKTLRETGSSLEATFNARDLLDFGRTGSWTAVRFLNQTVPFLNARLQGLDKLGRAATDPAQKAKFYGTVMTYAAASVLLYLIMKDDPDFKELKEWQRDTYHAFKLPGSETMYFFPRPFEVGAIATVAERLVEQMVDDEAHGALFAERLKFALLQTFQFSPIPQVFAPALDIAKNRDSFTGSLIETSGMKDLSPENRKRAWTSQTAIAASVGMSKILWDDVTLSPVQIEELVRSYLGWMGSTALGAADMMISRPLSGAAPMPAKEWFNVSRFAHVGPITDTKYSDLFYDRLDEVNRVWGDVRQARLEQNPELVKELIAEHRGELGIHKVMNTKGARITKINARMRQVYNDREMDKDAKADAIKKLKEQRNMIMKSTVQGTDKYVR